jgi:hypothetical protein
MIEVRGYSILDNIYCRQLDGHDVLVENSARIYELLDMFQYNRVLSLTVKRRVVVGKKQPSAEPSGSAVHRQCSPSDSGNAVVSQVLRYSEAMVNDFSPPYVYAIDNEGQLLSSQAGSNVGSQFPYMSTQKSRNVEKGKAIQNDDAQDDANIFFDMGEADSAAMEELRRKEEMKISEKIEDMRRIREDPFLQCEGDTNIKDSYVLADLNEHENEAANEPKLEPELEHVKKKHKTVKRGPELTTRCHSFVQIDDILDYMPSSKEYEFHGFLKDEDYFQPITMVPPKGRKSRRKKIPPRKWYDEKRLQPQEQLCLKMWFTNLQQFRNALIDLYISQIRNYMYHSSSISIIVKCIK